MKENMNIKAMNGRVVIIPEPAKKTTAGGIIIPESTKDYGKGTVFSIADSITDLQIGNVVIFGKYAGHVVSVDGQDYLIVKYEEIMGKLV